MGCQLARAHFSLPVADITRQFAQNVKDILVYRILHSNHSINLPYHHRSFGAKNKIKSVKNACPVSHQLTRDAKE